MKLDIFKPQWLDLVFEGRNKSMVLMSYVKKILKLH